MIIKLTDPSIAEELYTGWQESCIWSCLQGDLGEIYIKSEEEQTVFRESEAQPVSAVAVLGDYRFFAGKPDEELVSFQPVGTGGFRFMVPEKNKADDWGKLIEAHYGGGAKKGEHYALKKEPEIWTAPGKKQELQEIVSSLPAGFTLKQMDEELYHLCGNRNWCRDWVAHYPGWHDFQEHAIGVVILKNGEPVSGVSTYSHYTAWKGRKGEESMPVPKEDEAVKARRQGGIELQIDTREDYRRQGLARICAAGIILECIERGLYPSWDAQNKWSLGLSQKLGYHYSHAYTAYEINGESSVYDTVRS